VSIIPFRQPIQITTSIDLMISAGHTKKEGGTFYAPYTFNESMGDTIFDVSCVAPALDLRIIDTSATHRIPQGLSINSRTEIRSDVNVDKITNAMSNANALSAKTSIKLADKLPPAQSTVPLPLKPR
jgi:hypothetical protein